MLKWQYVFGRPHRQTQIHQAAFLIDECSHNARASTNKTKNNNHSKRDFSFFFSPLSLHFFQSPPPPPPPPFFLKSFSFPFSPFNFFFFFFFSLHLFFTIFNLRRMYPMFTSVLRRYVASTAISTQNFRKGADSMRLTGRHP